MTVIAIAGVAGAPGVTTVAIALSVHWPRPVLLLEADISAASTLMTGFFRSNLSARFGGIEKLALAAHRDVLRSEDLLDPARALSIAVHELPSFELPIPALPEGHSMWVIPGFVNLTTIDGNAALWGRLPALLRALSENGIDVIIDLGRLTFNDLRQPLLDTADQVLVCANASMTDLNRLVRRLAFDDLAVYRGDAHDSRWGLMLTKPMTQEVASSDFTSHTLPVVDVLPHDPAGAAVFSHGAQDTKPRRNKYRRAIRGSVTRLEQLLAQAALDRKEQR